MNDGMANLQCLRKPLYRRHKQPTPTLRAYQLDFACFTVLAGAGGMILEHLLTDKHFDQPERRHAMVSAIPS